MKRGSLKAILSPALFLLGPVFHTLGYNAYPLLKREVLLVVGLTAVIGIIIGLLIHVSPPALRLFLLALFLTAACDLYFDGGSFRGGLLLFAAIGVAVWLLRTHVETIVFMVGLALVMTSLLTPPPSKMRSSYKAGPVRPARSDLPPVFHFVLDGHSGMAGLATDTALTRDITYWLGGRGFRLFPNAYSSYYDTYKSIPALLNMTLFTTGAPYTRKAGDSKFQVKGNRYFDTMRAHGYVIRVYQSTYLDICGSASSSLASCFTYPFNSLYHASQLTLSTSSRARLITAHALTRRSYILKRALSEYRFGIRPRLARLGFDAPELRLVAPDVALAPSEVFDHLDRDVAAGSNGTLFFVHLLLPHSSYQYDANCRPYERLSTWLRQMSPTAPGGDMNTADSRTIRHRMYDEQVRCVMRQMDAFFSKLDSLGVYKSAVIVMHGDHGNRITLAPINGANAFRLTKQDLLDTYSALFTVKAPSLSPGVDTSTVNIVDVFRSFAGSGFRSTGLDSASHHGEPTVLLVNAPQEKLMPLSYPEPRGSLR